MHGASPEFKLILSCSIFLNNIIRVIFLKIPYVKSIWSCWLNQLKLLRKQFCHIKYSWLSFFSFRTWTISSHSPSLFFLISLLHSTPFWPARFLRRSLLINLWDLSFTLVFFCLTNCLFTSVCSQRPQIGTHSYSALN